MHNVSGSGLLLFRFKEAGQMATGSQNTFIGYEGGNGSGGAQKQQRKSFNTAVGYRALYAFTSGDQNVAMGEKVKV